MAFVESPRREAIGREARRKRLGQYFTGVRLAKLLAALSDTASAQSVIDPMVGSGDMLMGALAQGRPALLAGIEIDEGAYRACKERVGCADADLVLGSAFSRHSVVQLPSQAWDVVITNPPYVRYQTTAHANHGDLPDARMVRADLLETVGHLEALDDEDKRLFAELIGGYSGLADLAVPSWLLCAGLVRVGGTLAMLVPTTWLSRDYAHPIRYLLRRWFDLRCVIEDGDASWFSDALVRTTLVVATRVPRRESAFEAGPSAGGHFHVTLTARASDYRSLVGGLYPDIDPELSFATDLATWTRHGRAPSSDAVSCRWISAEHERASLRHASSEARWLPRVEPHCDLSARSARVPVPALMAELLSGTRATFCTLDEVGWRVGQGLRTGANKFFYLQTLGAEGGWETLQTREDFGGVRLRVPADAVFPALQRQTELPHGFDIAAVHLRGRVLSLDGYALPEDAAGLQPRPYAVMPTGLAEHVRTAARTNLGAEDDPKYLPLLSAVATNARSGSVGAPPRFWYQLPRFADRHRPSLFLARINGSHPRTFLNRGREALIDANFSTLWPTAEATLDEFALLALMNSSWVAAALELIGTVMGGGALKVEATHLRRLPLPVLPTETHVTLSDLGRRLAGEEPSDLVLDQIDMSIVGAMGATEPRAFLDAVRAHAARQLEGRSD
jgi:hypothetical protein